MDLKTELRWVRRDIPSAVHLDGTEVVQETELVLQYRRQSIATDYGATKTPNGMDYLTFPSWGPWMDVPIVDEKD